MCASCYDVITNKQQHLHRYGGTIVKAYRLPDRRTREKEKKIMMNIALTNLGKYNEGVLDYTWLTLPATEEEIAKAFDKIQVSHDGIHYYSNGEGQTAKNDYYGEYEEFFITDYECDYMQIGEYDSIERLNEIAEAVEDLEESQQAILKALLNDGYDLEEALEKIDDCILWAGCNDMTDVAYQYVDECGLLDNAGVLANYFDYEAFGRDLSFEGTWLETDEGMLEVR